MNRTPRLTLTVPIHLLLLFVAVVASGSPVGSGQGDPAGSPPSPSRYVGLPEEELFQPLLGDPKEPRTFATVLHARAGDKSTTVGAVGFGERLGIIERRGRTPTDGSSVWPGVFAQFDSKPNPRPHQRRRDRSAGHLAAWVVRRVSPTSEPPISRRVPAPSEARADQPELRRSRCSSPGTRTVAVRRRVPHRSRAAPRRCPPCRRRVSSPAAVLGIGRIGRPLGRRDRHEGPRRACRRSLEPARRPELPRGRDRERRCWSLMPKSMKAPALAFYDTDASYVGLGIHYSL